MVVVKLDSSRILPSVPDTIPLGLGVTHALFLAAFGICAKTAIEFTDPAPTLAFYGVYHRDPWNQLIHFFGVPLILWSMLVFAAHLPLTNAVTIPSIPAGCCRAHHVSWATLFLILYTALYFRIDVVGALMYTPIMLYMYATAIEWTANDQAKKKENGDDSWLGTKQVAKQALWMHLLGWYLQIHLGHKILEGAQPATLANMGAALTTAPLFAFYEGIWWLGFRTELQQRVGELVATYTQELCSQGATMRVCESLR